MIRNRFLLLLALPMLALAGCSEDSTEPQTPGTNDTGAINFEIGFAGQDGQTRVATAADFTSAFEDGDQIGIFAVLHGEDPAPSDPIHNVPLTYDKAAGTWSGEAYWPGDGTKLDFFAYYPYSAEATDPTAITFTVKTDQSGTTDGRSNYNLSDLLTVASDNGGAGWAEGAPVSLSFSHALAMVQLTIDEEADGIDFNEDMTVTLRGVKTAATLDLSAGLLPADGTAGDVTMYLAATDGTKRLYRALIPMQTVAAGAKLFRIENGDQTLTSDALVNDLLLSLGEAELFTLSTGGGTPDPDIDDVLDKITDPNFKAALTEMMNTDGWDANTDGKLSSAEAAAVTGAMNVSNKGITSLAGIEYFTALTELYCSGNALDALDVSKNTALTLLDCNNNDLDALDVSKNTALTTLNCSDNALDALDVTKNTALTVLWCYDNALDALDVSKNTVLEYLRCYGNALTTLDVTKNTELTHLNCSDNALDALDVSKNTALTQLYCSGNALTTLDVSKNTALTDLTCGDGGTTSLAVTVNAAHDISTDGNLNVRASDGNGTTTRITVLNTETNGVTVTGPTPGADIEKVLIPAAGKTFLMGSPTTEPGHYDFETQHEVTLTKDFRMGKYEITNAQYAAFLNVNRVGADGKSDVAGHDNRTLVYTHDLGLTYANGAWKAQAGYENHPVICVTWYGAKAYADWVGGSLPTEAQWEYACRAGTTTAYSYGADADEDYMWYEPNSGKTTRPVGQKLPNAWGLYDMHGNVFEWCSDWFDDYPAGSVTDPTGPVRAIGRVVRGGSWYDANASSCRSATRFGEVPHNPRSYIGFRVVFPAD